ncbi:hypothetical protein BDR06DRAFT_972594 [Suillus hirtellus]|nr:hypothetical protein BDR06DRAFT_972594 [Suillus hirtellus]
MEGCKDDKVQGVEVGIRGLYASIRKVLVGYVGQQKEQQDNGGWGGVLVGMTEAEKEAVIMDDDKEKEKENRIESLPPESPLASLIENWNSDRQMIMAADMSCPNERNILTSYWYPNRMMAAAMSSMLAHLTPPSSIGELNPALGDNVESYRLMSCNVKTPGSNTSNLAERKLSHHDTKVSSRHFTGHPPLSPSSDTSESSEDELYARQHLPHLKNLSHYVQHTKRQFKSYNRRHSHRPNAIELQFFQRSVRKYSGETELSLVDVEEILKQDALEYVQSTKEASSFKKMLVGRTLPDLEVEVDFNIGTFSCDLTSFAMADVQLDHMECVVHNSNLPKDNDSSLPGDIDHMDGGSSDSDSEVEFDS